MNGDGILQLAEDLDGDGNLDVAEDLDGDGNLDVAEDADGDGTLDVAEDADGDGVLDTKNELNLAAKDASIVQFQFVLRREHRKGKKQGEGCHASRFENCGHQ